MSDIQPFHVSRTSDGKTKWYSARDAAAGVSIPVGPKDKAQALVDSLNRAFAHHARTLLSESEQRARSKALEEAAKVALAPLSNLEFDRFILNGVTAKNKKGHDLFLSVADLENELSSRAAAIRALQSEER